MPGWISPVVIGVPGRATLAPAERVAELDASIACLRSDIERPVGIVGDPEEVVDERGWLPRDRRQIALVYYRL